MFILNNNKYVLIIWFDLFDNKIKADYIVEITIKRKSTFY